jgi:squalene-hopene/tetraprenyl-beta-curcumene cyclase
MSLIAAADDAYIPPIRAGLQYLADTQRSDGTWDEPYYTGTGFPGYGFGARLDFRNEKMRARIHQGTELQRGFMLNYNMYRHYFPLMAMGRARRFLSDRKQ